jgi:hypothetical protein
MKQSAKERHVIHDIQDRPKVAHLNGAGRKSPLTIEQKLAAHESRLHDATVANKYARQALGLILDSGDTAGEAKWRNDISVTAKAIEELSDAIAAGREEIEKAKRRKLANSNGDDLRRVERFLANVERDAAACDELAEAYGKALRKVRLSADASDAELSNCGVSYDPYAFKAKIAGILDMGLYLATDGVFGNNRTLETPSQIKQNGRGSLKLAATEYVTVKLRAVRDRLGITDQPPEAA